MLSRVHDEALGEVTQRWFTSLGPPAAPDEVGCRGAEPSAWS